MSTSNEAKMTVACSSCGKQLRAPVSWQGKTIKCPGCGTSFRASATAPGARAANAPLPQSHSTANSKPKFVEDRKGMDEFKALGAGIGLSLLGALLSVGIWYFVASVTKQEARWFSLAVGILVGLGMYAGYRKADFAMGALAALIALGTVIAGKYVMYSAFASELANEFTVTEVTGTRAVLFDEIYSQRTAGLNTGLFFRLAADDEDTTLSSSDKEKIAKARRELKRIRAQVVDELKAMGDEEVMKKIRAEHEPRWKSGLEWIYTEEFVQQRGYSMDRVPGYAMDEESKKADEKVAKMKPEEIHKEYLAHQAKKLREDLPPRMAELDMLRAERDGKAPTDPGPKAGQQAQWAEDHKKSIASLSDFDLYVTDLVVDAEKSQIESTKYIDAGAKVATGLSLMNPRSLFMILGTMSLAFGFATGGRFKS